jgi:hypothetical protein
VFGCQNSCESSCVFGASGRRWSKSLAAAMLYMGLKQSVIGHGWQSTLACHPCCQYHLPAWQTLPKEICEM